MKVVINDCYGGYGISFDAMLDLVRIKGLDYAVVVDESEKVIQVEGRNYYHWDIDRADKDLIQLLEEKGNEYVSDSCAQLKVIEIPDGIEYVILEFDGTERIVEKGRVWQ